MIAIIFGVSGAGKTTVGKLLARELGWSFIEADDFHPAANIKKMRSGYPLTDEDRWPWLERLRQQIARSLAVGRNAVLACSVLKRAYRDRLRVNDEVKFVFLRGDYAFVETQLRSRHGHFMNAALLQSQFDDLEEPQQDENVLTVELGRTPREMVDEVKTNLNLADSRLTVTDLGPCDWAADVSSMRTPAAIAQHINTANPATKDPVSARRYSAAADNYSVRNFIVHVDPHLVARTSKLTSKNAPESICAFCKWKHRWLCVLLEEIEKNLGIRWSFERKKFAHQRICSFFQEHAPRTEGGEGGDANQ